MSELIYLSANRGEVDSPPAVIGAIASINDYMETYGCNVGTPEARAAAANDFLRDQRVDWTIFTGGYTPFQLNALLGAVHQLDQVAGSVPFGWRYADNASLTQLGELGHDDTSHIHDMLRSAVELTDWRTNDGTYRALLRVTEKTVALREGSADKWRLGGRVVASTDYVEQLAAHPSFPAAYAQLRVEQLVSQDTSHSSQAMSLIIAERTILQDMLGLPTEVRDEVLAWIADVSPSLDNKGNSLSITQGGTVAMASWKEAIAVVTAVFEKGGLGGLRELCDLVEEEAPELERDGAPNVLYVHFGK